MYEAYFTKRLLEALSLADSAQDPQERSVHLRTSRYYRDLLQDPEKRRELRYPACIRAILLGIGQRPRLARITDLSCNGFRAELAAAVRPGQLVTVEIDGLSRLDAFVVWQEGEQTGCKFLNPLHPALVDAALAVGSHG